MDYDEIKSKIKSRDIRCILEHVNMNKLPNKDQYNNIQDNQRFIFKTDGTTIDLNKYNPEIEQMRSKPKQKPQTKFSFSQDRDRSQMNNSKVSKEENSASKTIQPIVFNQKKQIQFTVDDYKLIKK